jgi:hypothetical protein
VKIIRQIPPLLKERGIGGEVKKKLRRGDR